jgi:hypothetical protein
MLTHTICVDKFGRLLRFDGDLQLVASLNPHIYVVFVKVLAQDTSAGGFGELDRPNVSVCCMLLPTDS